MKVFSLILYLLFWFVFLGSDSNGNQQNNVEVDPDSGLDGSNTMAPKPPSTHTIGIVHVTQYKNTRVISTKIVGPLIPGVNADEASLASGRFEKDFTSMKVTDMENELLIRKYLFTLR